MKKAIIILAISLINAFNTISQNCVQGISTNIEDPVNNEFPGIVNPWLNTSFKVSQIQHIDT